jgi:hypothetical protein
MKEPLTYHQHCCDVEAVPIIVVINSDISFIKGFEQIFGNNEKKP